MEKIFWENETLTKIVQMLSYEGEFSEISMHVMALAGECVECESASLFQITPQGDKLISVAEWTNGNVDLPEELPRDMNIFGEHLIVINDEEAYSAYKDDAMKLSAKKLVVSPLTINGNVAMYLVFALGQGEESFSKFDITFITNVSAVLEAVVQKTIINDSLLCSYTALQDVLNNVGCQVIVYDSENGEIQFENKMAREDKSAQKVVAECAKWYFNEKQKGEEQKNITEKYNGETGQWYEIKFSELVWVDGRDVTMCTVFDVTQKKKNLEKIQFQAQNDFLTGLYNRMKCEKDLRKLIATVSENGEKAAVLFLDLDDFKHINDGLGHQYGDVLLQEIALGLSNIPGLKGHCYRMGGDEFVIILVPEVYKEKERVLEDVSVMFNKPWYLMETEYYCTMSMGIVEFPAQGDTVSELIKKADIAMYEAKKAGKNRYTFYTEDNSNQSTKRLDVEHNMRQAVESECEEFVVHYQPIIEIEQGKCIGCEALVRWNSKVFGLMEPGDFIPLAEYLGLITYIGDFVLEQACIQCREWNEKYDPDFRMSINLSVVQLLQSNVVENIRGIIDKTKVNPKNIILEITETLAINDMERIIKIIDGIKEMGISIALDDFGTGYSSLNYIKDLNLDIIKVDKTFIDDITDEDYELVFVKLITDLSKRIGVKVCIEGVERPEQIEVLKRDVNADWFQGFYYSRPIPNYDFERHYF